MELELGFTKAMEGVVTWQVIGAISGVSTIVALVVVWLFSKFQTKSEAKEMQAEIDRLETDVKEITRNLAKIGSDVSYIRGRLEPKT